MELGVLMPRGDLRERLRAVVYLALTLTMANTAGCAVFLPRDGGHYVLRDGNEYVLDVEGAECYAYNYWSSLVHMDSIAEGCPVPVVAGRNAEGTALFVVTLGDPHEDGDDWIGRYALKLDGSVVELPSKPKVENGFAYLSRDLNFKPFSWERMREHYTGRRSSPLEWNAGVDEDAEYFVSVLNGERIVLARLDEPFEPLLDIRERGLAPGSAYVEEARLFKTEVGLVYCYLENARTRRHFFYVFQEKDGEWGLARSACMRNPGGYPSLLDVDPRTGVALFEVTFLGFPPKVWDFRHFCVFNVFTGEAKRIPGTVPAGRCSVRFLQGDILREHAAAFRARQQSEE